MTDTPDACAPVTTEIARAVLAIGTRQPDAMILRRSVGDIRLALATAYARGLRDGLEALHSPDGGDGAGGAEKPSEAKKSGLPAL